jgi:hypothetical protein
MIRIKSFTKSVFTMTNFTKLLALLFFVAGSMFSLSAQTTFWEEDFSDGDIPVGWNNEDAGGFDALWEWCGDGASEGPGCPLVWGDGLNMQEAFAAATADNGFVSMDSDEVGNIPGNHVSELTTSAIDCSGQTEVWLKFEAHIGVFTISAEEGAIVRVSTDGGDSWDSFTAFPGLVTGAPNPGFVRWSTNPEYVIIDISAVAAGETDVLVQWQWTGNFEYHWSIDDVALYDEDPTPIFIPAHDMQVNSNFYAVAPNVFWPLNQASQFGFLADIQNNGSQDQTNVNLNINIIDALTSDEVYDEDLAYGTIPVDSLAENQLFPGDGFTPTDMTTYQGTYTLTADSVDLNPDNNTQVFEFTMTDTLWAKESGADNINGPADTNWNAGDGHSWAYGNCFYVVNADNEFFRYAQFVTESPDIVGESVLFSLYTWEDGNADGDADPDERSLLGFTAYTITGDETIDDIITLEIADIAGNPIALEDETYYLAMIEYQTDVEGETMALAFGDSPDFGAMTFRSQELGDPRFGSMLGVAASLETEPYSSLGFGTDVVPVVRISIGDQVSANVEEVLDAANDILVFPNPTADVVNVTMDFVNTMESVWVNLFDANGKLLQTQEFQNVDRQQTSFEVSNLAAGMYMIHIATKEGSRTERFTITK